MSEMVGFSDGFGTFTTGGSNGNMLGMLCAREHLLAGSTKQGFDGRTTVIFVSAEAHYSVLMAANVIGIGHQNIIKVQCDEDGRMRPDRLEEEIALARREGMRPLCVVATAATTVRGAYDDLEALSEVAHREGLWLHVDAAWGGTCLFSNVHAALMDGVQKADSVCWDAHKMMGVPLICSAFLIKNPDVLRRLCDHTNVAHYCSTAMRHQTTSDGILSSVHGATMRLSCGLNGALVAMQAGLRWWTLEWRTQIICRRKSRLIRIWK